MERSDVSLEKQNFSTSPSSTHPPNFRRKKSDFQREDRKVKAFEMKRHSITASHNIENGQGMTIQLFHEKAKEVGEALGRQFLQTTLGAVDEAVQETGQEVKIQKGNLQQNDILKMLEITHQNFDKNGNPTAQMVCGSEFADELRKRAEEWRDDKEFLTKVKEIITRKRMEFDEREACRRLVD